MSRSIPSFFVLFSAADEPESLLGRPDVVAFEDLDALYRDALARELSLDEGRCIVEVEAARAGEGRVRPTRVLGVHPLEDERVERARAEGS